MKDPEPRGLRHSTAASVDAARSAAGPYLATSMLQRKQRGPFPCASGQHQRPHHILVGGFHRKVIPHNWLASSRSSPCFTQNLLPKGRKADKRNMAYGHTTWLLPKRGECLRSTGLRGLEVQFCSTEFTVSRLICHWNPG